ncbi:MAG: NifB/NifX family molybdenum-iron cluster-binding protein [Spirochaetales bacterium]|nr:NifB/NifX family molybdenum-iron cluster-binding protein [Spirochaetales bacterium]
MKIAFSAQGDTMDSMIDPRFGRAAYLVVYDDESGETSGFDNQSITGVAHGAGPQTSQKLMEMGAQVLITGNGPGGNAQAVLRKTNTKVFVGAAGMTLREAYNAYKRGALQEF